MRSRTPSFLLVGFGAQERRVKGSAWDRYKVSWSSSGSLNLYDLIDTYSTISAQIVKPCGAGIAFGYPKALEYY
jgi:hypothetical protein